LLNESVDVVLSVSEITSLDEMSEFSCAETTSWVGELEWPQEVVDLLEVWSNGEDLVDDIFNADNAVLSEFSLDDGVVSESNTLLVATTCISRRS